MKHLDHVALMAAQEPAFPEYDENGWPSPIAAALLNIHEDVAHLRQLRNASKHEIERIAESLEDGSRRADEYVATVAGPGLAPDGPRLSKREQEHLLRNPHALSLLMDYHDQQQDQADSMGAGCHGNQVRYDELKAIGAAIVADDPQLWDDEIIRRFGVRP